MTATAIAAVAGVFLAAGVVKGVIGLGLPTLSMALLALWMAPVEAAALLIVPSLVTNVWQMKPWPTLAAMWRRIGGMQIGVCVGTWIGAVLFGAPAGAWATGVLGAALMVYAMWGLLGRDLVLAPRHERWLGPVAGALTGLLTAVTGVFVVPAVAYLQALGLQRDGLVQAMGISFTTSTVALAIALVFELGNGGGYSAAALGMSVAMLLPALAGMVAGQWLRGRLSPAIFRRCFLIGLGLLGAYMAARAVY
ncbi:MAG: hypothetical protein JWQ73_1216, partial [Variovorax sp.]|nr:hypothetical protein [Variovorax sp.]